MKSIFTTYAMLFMKVVAGEAQDRLAVVELHPKEEEEVEETILWELHPEQSNPVERSIVHTAVVVKQSTLGTVVS